MIYIKEIKVKFPKWKWWQYGIIVMMIILAITQSNEILDILVNSGMRWLQVIELPLFTKILALMAIE